MQVKLQIVEMRLEKWPARGDRPAGEARRIYGRDNTQPLRQALRDSVLLRVTEDDVAKYWDKLIELEDSSPTIVVAVRKVGEFRGDQTFEGDILSIEGEDPTKSSKVR